MAKSKRGGFRPYHYTAEFREIANAALARFNAKRPFLPKCGATRKSDGGACQNLPLANGRCRLHGGRTPKGDEWHKPQWPSGEGQAAMKKLHNKLAALERQAKSRARRLAAMTDQERARYERWHAQRPVGSSSLRVAVKLEKARAEEAARALGAPRENSSREDPEYCALVNEIAVLKELLRQTQVKVEAAQVADQFSEVFG